MEDETYKDTGWFRISQSTYACGLSALTSITLLTSVVTPYRLKTSGESKNAQWGQDK